MRVCPNCGEKAVSEIKLLLQRLGIPGCICTCNACDEWVSYKETDSFFKLFLLPDIIFVLCIVLSAIIFFNAWIGLIVFILSRALRLYFLSKGDLELPNENI